MQAAGLVVCNINRALKSAPSRQTHFIDTDPQPSCYYNNFIFTVKNVRNSQRSRASAQLSGRCLAVLVVVTDSPKLTEGEYSLGGLEVHTEKAVHSEAEDTSPCHQSLPEISWPRVHSLQSVPEECGMMADNTLLRTGVLP